jgi:hypothetical protein
VISVKTLSHAASSRRVDTGSSYKQTDTLCDRAGHNMGSNVDMTSAYVCITPLAYYVFVLPYIILCRHVSSVGVDMNP